MGLTLLDFELMEGQTDATIPSLVTHYEVSSNVHKEEERAACLSILLGPIGVEVLREVQVCLLQLRNSSSCSRHSSSKSLSVIFHESLWKTSNTPKTDKPKDCP